MDSDALKRAREVGSGNRNDSGSDDGRGGGFKEVVREEKQKQEEEEEEDGQRCSSGMVEGMLCASCFSHATMFRSCSTAHFSFLLVRKTKQML